MQNLMVTPQMRALIGGAFYPSGYSLIMYPTEAEILPIAARLTEARFNDEDLFRVSPHIAIEEIAATVDSSNMPLPSVGSDGAIARTIVDMAKQGHYGLLVRTDKDGDIEALKNAIANSDYSFAKAYRSFVIEDLE